jgi:hypothetical protein
VIENVEMKETFEGFGEIDETDLSGKPRQKNGPFGENETGVRDEYNTDHRG